MLKINIIALGKNKDAWVDQSIAHYSRLLKKYADLSLVIVPELKKGKSLSRAELLRAEAERLTAAFRARYQVALWEGGKSLDSKRFAAFLGHLMEISGGSADFIIGGAFGLDKSILKRCRTVLSLSPLTMSHRLVRPVLLEQLYRGFSILSGGRYHK